MLDSLFTRTVRFQVKGKSGGGSDFEFVVNGTVEPLQIGGQSKIRQENGKTIVSGVVGPGVDKQGITNEYRVRGEVLDTMNTGGVDYNETKVISENYAGLFYGAAGLLLVGILSNFYSS